jgi:hypothetical protein
VIQDNRRESLDFERRFRLQSLPYLDDDGASRAVASVQFLASGDFPTLVADEPRNSLHRGSAFPQLPANRTYRRHSPNDANDPKQT